MSYKKTAKAVEVEERADAALMCRANGCRLRWTVQTGDVTACSYHAWADPKDWPRITEELRRNGPWLLRHEPGTSPTVRDMKTRVRGHIGNLG